MKIGLIGTGRLGLCFALLVERAGYSVLASDNREDYIKDLQKGVLGTTEPDVHDLLYSSCLLYTSPSPRDRTRSRMPSSA